MVVNKSYNFRIYPNEEQKVFFAKSFGCSRFVYNYLLDQKQKHYEENKGDKQKLKDFKFRTEKSLKDEFPWLGEVDFCSLQQSRRNLEQGYSNFLNTFKPGYKGMRYGRPTFKSKYDKQSYRTVCGNKHAKSPSIRIDYENKLIRLPKCGWVKYSDDRYLPNSVSSVIITKNPSGQYFASIRTTYEIPDNKISEVREDKIFAADMSCSDFLVSEQDKFENPKSYRKSEKKIAKFQRKMSKKTKGSKNYEKARVKVAKIYQKVKNQKDDFLHKVSRDLVNKYDAVILEDLNIEAMRVFGLNKSVALDFSFGMFSRMVEYKSLWAGKHFVEVGRFFPSSKTCSNCGQIKDSLLLSERIFRCDCGFECDRDINAARNIMREGKRILLESGINLTNSTAGAAESYACGGTGLWPKETLVKSAPVKQEIIAL